MIGILLVTHEDLGECLIRCATHIMGDSQPQLMHINVFSQDDPKLVIDKARGLICELDSGDGVLVLSDIYGATPSNIACQLITPGKVDCMSGVNLPMLVRALTYRNEPLLKMIEKALDGGKNGVMHIQTESNHAT